MSLLTLKELFLFLIINRGNSDFAKNEPSNLIRNYSCAGSEQMQVADDRKKVQRELDVDRVKSPLHVVEPISDVCVSDRQPLRESCC